jgi:hypothetical protein
MTTRKSTGSTKRIQRKKIEAKKTAHKRETPSKSEELNTPAASAPADVIELAGEPVALTAAASEEPGEIGTSAEPVPLELVPPESVPPESAPPEPVPLEFHRATDGGTRSRLRSLPGVACVRALASRAVGVVEARTAPLREEIARRFPRLAGFARARWR